MRRMRSIVVAAALAQLVVAAPALAGELARAKQMIGQQRYSDAIRPLEKFTRQFPDDPEGWKLLASCYENVFPPRVEDDNHALTMANQAYNLRTGMLTTFRHVGPSSEYEKLVADDPQDPESNLLLALAYMVNDRAFAKAKPVLDHLAELGVPANLADPYHDALGLYDLSAHQWDLARKEFNSALQGDNSELSLAFLQQVDKDEQSVQAADQAEANSPAVRFKQLVAGAQGFVQQNNPVAAVDLLRDALNIEPNDTGAQNLLAQAKQQGALQLYDEGRQLVTQKDYADAYDKFSKAIEFDPTNASASIALDFARKMLNQPKVIMKRVPVSSSGAGE